MRDPAKAVRATRLRAKAKTAAPTTLPGNGKPPGVVANTQNAAGGKWNDIVSTEIPPGVLLLGCCLGDATRGAAAAARKVCAATGIGPHMPGPCRSRRARSERHDDPAHAPQPRPQEQLRLQRAGRRELALRRPRPRPPRPAHDPVPLVQDVAVAAEDPGRALPLDPEGARPAGAGPVAEAPQRRAALAGLPQEPREVPDLARDP
eukprot:CAMPEP_0179243812 /NCGR_PEP_ID=MMETSP0797-20121207/17737_1 /TAXON_ID=47934 /ORGANISM="Dinophysis acuminata, Strain DAEP01" /LENGTH=204 /DNA_ID=CAMNT_0020951313 /DNA_START=664 /DNA_END=1275 /DNA_ORIENTATION=+